MTRPSGAAAPRSEAADTRGVKPILVLGLGNDLAGDDGVGIRVARRLAEHPGLPEDVEVRIAGSDLLRYHHAMRGRERVILVDALLGPGAPGTLLVLDPADLGLADAGRNAHQLSPTGALTVLRAADPTLADVPVTLLGVTIQGAAIGTGLSDGLAHRLDGITTRILRLLSRETSSIRSPGAG